MAGDDGRNERLITELSLVESMYPDQIRYQPKGGELRYKDDLGSFVVRLPDAYLHDALPEVVSASAGRVDVREAFKAQISSQCEVGAEVLDAIIMIFHEVVQQCQGLEIEGGSRQDEMSGDMDVDERKATIIVYLHHLLNTNKRKQCLSPPNAVSGVTKPGYPGVLVYSGLSQAVHEHVNELKALNWQAFQVRMEVQEEWTFKHGAGVVEVESLGEVVQEVEGSAEHDCGENVGKKRKTEFLEAMKMKG